MLAVSASPAPSAEAQTTTVPQHVSNLGQTNLSFTGQWNYHATSFTTGGRTSDRFTLRSVVLHVQSLGASATVGIYTDSSGNPGPRFGGFLVRQGSATSGQITFNAPPVGITLVGRTTYWLRTYHPTANRLRVTDSDNEDAGSASGWSIGDSHIQSSDGVNWPTTTDSLRFRINWAPPAVPIALPKAWGLTGIAPPSEPEDAWDGSARDCRHNFRGYYNLEGPARWHGLGMGCHTHGQGHHEHARERH